MNQADPVMQDVWRAKAANATKHQSLAAYMAFLRKRGKRKHPGGRIGLPANAKGQLLPELPRAPPGTTI